MRYLLSVPIRLVLALFSLFMSFLFLFGPAIHWLIAHQLKENGKEVNALILKKIKSRKRQGNKWTKQYYVLQFPEGRRSLVTTKKYSEGKYINVVYMEDPPQMLNIPFTQGKQKIVTNDKNFVVQGKKKDWLIWLYLASAKKDFADYSLTHTTLGFIFIYIATKSLFPFLFSKKT